MMTENSRPVRVIVHPGFHKTGTTSLQDFFRSNRKALQPYCSYYGKADFLAAGSQARIYAQRPFPWRLRRFRLSFRRFLNGIERSGTIIISRETFSGGMPGHRRIDGSLMASYQKASRMLAKTIVAEIRNKFGRDTEITFFYTTREPESWINSIYGHLLRSIRLRDDFPDFRARFPNLVSPQQEAEDMAAFLAPIRVLTAAMEDHVKKPESTAAPLLDLLDIPAKKRAALKPARHANKGQSKHLRDRFLMLNRSIRNKPALKVAKDEQLDMERTKS